jgi:hypothetical protein
MVCGGSLSLHSSIRIPMGSAPSSAPRAYLSSDLVGILRTYSWRPGLKAWPLLRIRYSQIEYLYCAKIALEASLSFQYHRGVWIKFFTFAVGP